MVPVSCILNHVCGTDPQWRRFWVAVFHPNGTGRCALEPPGRLASHRTSAPASHLTLGLLQLCRCDGPVGMEMRHTQNGAAHMIYACSHARRSSRIIVAAWERRQCGHRGGSHGGADEVWLGHLELSETKVVRLLCIRNQPLAAKICAPAHVNTSAPDTAHALPTATRVLPKGTTSGMWTRKHSWDVAEYRKA